MRQSFRAQASLIDDLVTKYSAEGENYKQLETTRRLAKGISKPFRKWALRLWRRPLTPDCTRLPSLSGYGTKTIKARGGRYQRSAASSGPAGADGAAGTMLSRMKTLKLGKPACQVLALRSISS